MDNLSEAHLSRASPASLEQPFYAQGSEAVIRSVGRRIGGLTSDEAAARLEVHVSNELPVAVGVHPVRRFLAQFNNALIYFLIAAAVGTAMLGQFVDTTVIAAVVTVVAAQLAFTYLPIMQWLLDTRPIGHRDGLLILVVGGVVMAVLEVEKIVMRRTGWMTV